MKTTIAALLLVTLVACGSPTESEPGAGGNASDPPATMTPYDPDSPVSCPPDCPDDGGDVEPGKPKIVTPRPGMDNLRPIAWEKARPLGPRRVLITYWSGVEPCYVLDHIDVDYETKEVVITLYEGSDPAEKDAACIEIALQKAVKVTLDEPLGERKLTDGAA